MAKLDSRQSLSKPICCLLDDRYKFKVDKVTINSFMNKVILYVNVLDTSMKLRVFSKVHSFVVVSSNDDDIVVMKIVNFTKKTA